MIIIDVGSSTTKIYNKSDSKLELLFTRSISFKDDIKSSNEISSHKILELIKIIKEFGKDDQKVKVFGTALFRGLSEYKKRKIVDEIFEKTNVFFYIIDQELESFYLEKALLGKCTSTEETLLMNIGGGSSEIILSKIDTVLERNNIDVGVKSVLDNFSGLNNEYSQYSLNDVVSWIKGQLPDMRSKARIAFYNGGELTYMRIAGYPIVENILFIDANHPSIIRFDDFVKYNEKVFSSITLDALEKMMPEDPMWMHGARACSAIAQAICEKYGVDIIVPSDSNTSDGLIRQEYRNVTISGSFRKYFKEILRIKKYFEAKGVTVLSPRYEELKNTKDLFVRFEDEQNESALKLERYHMSCIEKSDALIVVCNQGYVGASTMLEIGYANALGKKIVFTEEPEEYILKILPSQIGI